jgi:hypothetical protein
MHLPVVTVDPWDTLTGVIHKELLPSVVVLAHDQSKFVRPASLGVTKPAVLQAVGRSRLLFLPQQEQRDARAFELVVDGGPIRHQVWGGSSGRDGRQQHPFQRALIIGCG